MKAREPDRPSRTRWVEQPSMTLLPAAKGKCPECGTAHPPEQPHNQTSLYYQMKFNMAQRHVGVQKVVGWLCVSHSWTQRQLAVVHSKEAGMEVWNRRIEKTQE